MMWNSLASQRVSGRIAGCLSQSKLSNLLAGLVIFFSATQLGYHFWPLSSLVYGIRIDYLSPTIYFLDLLIILYLGLRTVLKRKTWLQAKLGKRSTSSAIVLEKWLQKRSILGDQHERTVLVGTLGSISPLLLTNLLYSQNPLATLSWSLHFVLYLLFVLCLRRLLDRRRGQRPSRDANGGRSLLTGVLQLALFFQTTLASLQVYLGHSVGGLMYYLGERNIAVGSPSIALGSFKGEVILRAYGTFSHPNILAGYAVLSLLIILHLRGLSSQAKFPTRDRIVSPLLFTTLLIFLAQSRSAAISLFMFIVPIHFFKNLKSRIIYFAFLLVPIIYLLTTGSPPRSELSLSQRLDLQGLSLKVISNYPIFGTGAQASISTYPTVAPSNRLLQPDHNSLTLFLSWFGLFGILTILFILSQQFRSLRDSRRVIGTLIFSLPLLLLDHYLLTSPQGLLILLIYLAVAVNYSHVKENI